MIAVIWIILREFIWEPHQASWDIRGLLLELLAAATVFLGGKTALIFANFVSGIVVGILKFVSGIVVGILRHIAFFLSGTLAVYCGLCLFEEVERSKRRREAERWMGKLFSSAELRN